MDQRGKMRKQPTCPILLETERHVLFSFCCEFKYQEEAVAHACNLDSPLPLSLEAHAETHATLENT